MRPDNRVKTLWDEFHDTEYRLSIVKDGLLLEEWRREFGTVAGVNAWKWHFVNSEIIQSRPMLQGFTLFLALPKSMRKSDGMRFGCSCEWCKATPPESRTGWDTLAWSAIEDSQKHPREWVKAHLVHYPELQPA